MKAPDAVANKIIEIQQALLELQSVETRYNTVSAWLTAFAEHIENGDILDVNDYVILKQLVEKIIVRDTEMEIHFKCDGNVTQKYR